MSNIFEGGASGMSTERVYSTDALNDFVTEIGNEITGACMIPMNLPQVEVEAIIKNMNILFMKISLLYRKLRSVLRILKHQELLICHLLFILYSVFTKQMQVL